MKYESTRGDCQKVDSALAIKMGIAPDKGLFVPEEIKEVAYYKYTDMEYRERAFDILSKYLTDFTEEEIKECVDNAYNEDKFDDSAIAKVKTLTDNMHILELWHGPTCAFKDMALQILPHFMQKAMIKTQEDKDILILVATSGDTGKAALEGFKDVKGTNIIVFFPMHGVSAVQKYQMITQEGSNVKVVSVDGNFDDAQNGVKEIFTNSKIKKDALAAGMTFSSANSINWGRLVPQIVYYFSAYADLVKSGKIEDGEKINIVVPTGNFGNILAAFYAKKMSLPVNKLVCASNENNVLTDFIQTGVYDRNRDFKKTLSPSMDILISSNLERLLYELVDRDSGKINKWMKQLEDTGCYEVDEETKRKLKDLFFAGSCDDNETLTTIHNIYNEYNYLIDTHTAVGIDVYDKYVIATQDIETKTVIASTASPFKFGKAVYQSLNGEENLIEDEFKLLDTLSNQVEIDIPKGLRGLNEKEVLHDAVCDRLEMKEFVLEYLNEKGGEID